jgi:hypothetical protein
MAYCSITEARAAGATGSDPDVTQAIADAQERIDRYTGDTFESGNATVVATIGSDGVAVLPHKVQSVTSVTFVGATTALDTAAYRVRKSSTPGDIDAIEMAGYGYGQYAYNDLIAGAERWNGGYANLAQPGRRITVVGSFGWAAVPAPVKRAAALLAAQITSAATGDEYAGVKSLSVEGYSVTFAADGTISSTGLPEVDQLLTPYRRTKVRVG